MNTTVTVLISLIFGILIGIFVYYLYNSSKSNDTNNNNKSFQATINPQELNELKDEIKKIKNTDDNQEKIVYYYPQYPNPYLFSGYLGGGCGYHNRYHHGGHHGGHGHH